MSEPVHNRAFDHVGVSVPDCEADAEWYKRLFGFQPVSQIRHIKRSEQPKDSIFGIYPASLNEFKTARLTTGNGVGFEIFEFIDLKTYVPQTEFEYHRGGIFHICVTDADPDTLADKMVETGGKRIGKSVHPLKNVIWVYAADPWGNVVEILDASFERVTTLAYEVTS